MKSGLLFLLVCTASVSLAQLQMSAAQKEVWAGEEAFCRTSMSGDTEGFMSLWDDHFIGWPSNQSAPVDKETIRKLTTRKRGPRDMKCESTPLAVNVFGDTAMTFYLYRTTTTGADGKATSHVGRFTHTWRRTHGKWHIIGGMSAPQTEK